MSDSPSAVWHRRRSRAAGGAAWCTFAGMKLTRVAKLMEISPSYLRKLVVDVRKPQRDRRYPEASHEYYFSRWFVKDTKGRRDVHRGRFEWHIADHLVSRWVRDRDRRLSGRVLRRSPPDLYQRLAAVGIDLTDSRTQPVRDRVR